MSTIQLESQQGLGGGSTIDKDYVDRGDIDSLHTAQAYTDTKVSEASTAATEYTDAAVADKTSVTYVDNEVANAKNTAISDSKAYTDVLIQNEVNTRLEADNALTEALNASQGKLNKQLVSNLAVEGGNSTVTVKYDDYNPNAGSTTGKEIVLPVVDATHAGIMNSATYQTIQDNAANIDAILDAAVAISGLSATVTQAQLTAAWKQATGRTTLVNGAKINDSTNQKVWSYYTNTNTWYAATNTAQVTVSQATNTSLGIVKGSTTNGKIAVESDGSLSLNGYDALSSTSSTSAAAIETLQSGKVDKVSGKQLSTNDYTTTEKNKLAGIAAGAEVNVQADWNVSDTSSDAFIKNKPALKTVATTGAYSDLTGKPTYATVASTGAYADLSGKPTLSTVATSGKYSDLSGTPSLATVATSGSYNDLSNKPTIPAAQVNANWTATSGVAQILNKPTLATVATSGSYTDLSNKPTIPTVNNATLTIQKNGSNVATFTANSSSNATANITVPVITMQTTDPGEGATLAANNFIAVY